jgi:phosphoribosylanthranilate isomerase
MEDVEYVNEALPDYIGFIFAESRRQVSVKLAEAMKEELNPAILTVGVFVNAPMEEVLYLLKRRIIDMAQLHGGEDEAYMKGLRSETHNKIIKAIRVESAEDILSAQKNQADYLLLDHGAGGTGESFNWDYVPESGKPFFLAGGIHSGNIGQAMQTGKPYALDISSGAETNGVKDKEKILELVRRVRNDERQIRNPWGAIYS